MYLVLDHHPTMLFCLDRAITTLQHGELDNGDDPLCRLLQKLTITFQLFLGDGRACEWDVPTPLALCDVIHEHDPMLVNLIGSIGRALS